MLAGASGGGTGMIVFPVKEKVALKRDLSEFFVGGAMNSRVSLQLVASGQAPVSVWSSQFCVLVLVRICHV
jgi:hypothetical protein